MHGTLRSTMQQGVQQAAAGLQKEIAAAAAVTQPYDPLRFSTPFLDVSPTEAAGAGSIATGTQSASADDDEGLEVDNDHTLCVICLAAPRTHALVHGADAHLWLCEACCTAWDYKSKGCPICRQEVEYVLEVH